MCALQRLDFVGDGTVHARSLFHLAEFGLHTFQVGQCQLQLHHTQVFEWVARSGNVVVDEGTEHEHDCIDFADVGKELVAETLTFARAFHQATDVDNFDGGIHHFLAFRHLRQRIKTRVEHLCHADVGIFRGERIRSSQCV